MATAQSVTGRLGGLTDKPEPPHPPQNYKWCKCGNWRDIALFFNKLRPTEEVGRCLKCRQGTEEEIANVIRNWEVYLYSFLLRGIFRLTDRRQSAGLKWQADYPVVDSLLLTERA